GLASELAFGADFAGHAGHFGRERSELVHHRVDGFFQVENFAADVHGDLFRQVAIGHGRCHRCDVSHLSGEVAGHGIHRVGEILPLHGALPIFGLAAELAFGAHFAGHAGDFGREGTQLVHHGIDGVFQLENFTLHVHGDLFGQVAIGDGGGHGGDVADLCG